MNLARRLRHRIEYLAFLTIAGIIRALPLEMASRWSGAGWRLVAPRLGRHRRALQNLALAFPEKSPAEIERIARGMWDNLGRTFAEFFHLQETVAGDRIEFERPEMLDAMRARGGGMVACGLHLGNWEITAQAAVRCGAQAAGVYQKITNPLVDRLRQWGARAVLSRRPDGKIAAHGKDDAATCARGRLRRFPRRPARGAGHRRAVLRTSRPVRDLPGPGRPRRRRAAVCVPRQAARAACVFRCGSRKSPSRAPPTAKPMSRRRPARCRRRSSG